MIKINVFTKRMLNTLQRRRYRETPTGAEQNRAWARAHPYRRIRVVTVDGEPQVVIRKPHVKSPERAQDYRARNRERILQRNRENARKRKLSGRVRQLRRDLKLRVLTYYGANGHLKCCWAECDVEDLDMLTLDHVGGNGNAHRKELTTSIYAWVVRNVFPPGFQTLCGNHQMKKEFLKRYSGS